MMRNRTAASVAGARTVVAFVLLGLGLHCQAGNVTDARITMLLASEHDVYFVHVDRPIVNAAACATQPRFAVRPSSASGKAMIATLLAAHATGKTLDITGKGEFFSNTTACDVWADSESIGHFVVR